VSPWEQLSSSAKRTDHKRLRSCGSIDDATRNHALPKRASLENKITKGGGSVISEQETKAPAFKKTIRELEALMEQASEGVKCSRR
jgi:hypothetical protein